MRDSPSDNDDGGEKADRNKVSRSNDDDEFESQLAPFISMMRMSDAMTPRTLLRQSSPSPLLPPPLTQDVEFDSGIASASGSGRTGSGLLSLSSGNPTVAEGFAIDQENIQVRRKRPAVYNVPSRFLKTSKGTKKNNSVPRHAFNSLQKKYMRWKREALEWKRKAENLEKQATLLSYGIKFQKNSVNGNISPKIFKTISQQVADTFHAPVIVCQKRRMKTPVTANATEVHLSMIASPGVITNPSIPAMSEDHFNASQLSQSQSQSSPSFTESSNSPFVASSMSSMSLGPSISQRIMTRNWNREASFIKDNPTSSQSSFQFSQTQSQFSQTQSQFSQTQNQFSQTQSQFSQSFFMEHSQTPSSSQPQPYYLQQSGDEQNESPHILSPSVFSSQFARY